MRHYETEDFTITFNGYEITFDVEWGILHEYFMTLYTPSFSDGVYTLLEYNQEEICEEMDRFCLIAKLNDSNLKLKIKAMLAISSKPVQKEIHDYLGQIQRNVPDAGTVKRQDIPEEKPKDKGIEPGIDNKLF